MELPLLSLVLAEAASEKGFACPCIAAGRVMVLCGPAISMSSHTWACHCLPAVGSGGMP